VLPNSLIPLFQEQCRLHADQPAYVFLRDDLAVADSLSFAQLADECDALAGRLGALVAPGGRVLLAFPPGLDFVRAFWACLLAGCVAVPVPAPDPLRLRHGAPRLRGILEDTGAALVLTSASLIDAARDVLEPALRALAPWIALDDLRAGRAAPTPGDAPAPPWRRAACACGMRRRWPTRARSTKPAASAPTAVASCGCRISMTTAWCTA
jgi:acyl-CoA synthetase (AMP-forming)/AMP-acid ligase II